MKQTTNTIIMVRPASFRMNEQTAINNYYQQQVSGVLPVAINTNAQEEFDIFVEKLKNVGIHVIVINDTEELNTPDALFPNNWISFHENKKVVLYPMFAENRRSERREDILELLKEKGFVIEHIIDYSKAEEENTFLEGTGSMILDRQHKKAYCALSPRADEKLFLKFCKDFDYMPVIFVANQTVKGRREAIYHTNVMMCIAETFAIVCLEAIDNKKEKKNVVQHLTSDGKEVIAISEDQVTQFAGNMLQVQGQHEQSYLVMSSSAYHSLHNDQIRTIEKHTKILHSPLKTVETYGGGSARCMMAEVFLPKV